MLTDWLGVRVFLEVTFRLEEFKYVNSLKDILVVKELLKQEYFRDDIDFLSKSTLLYALIEFVEIDDESFYNQTLKSALSYQNIHHSIKLIQDITKALEYIKLLKREYIDKLKIIKNRDNVIKKLCIDSIILWIHLVIKNFAFTKV